MNQDEFRTTTDAMESFVVHDSLAQRATDSSEDNQATFPESSDHSTRCSNDESQSDQPLHNNILDQKVDNSPSAAIGERMDDTTPEDEPEIDTVEEKSTQLALADEDSLDPPSTFHRDMEIKTYLQCQRNKQLLISRLAEASPRGKLALINLSRRGLGVEEAILLKETVISNPQLYTLKLSYNKLGDEGASIIASSLLHNGKRHQLSVLDLGFNAIGDAGCGSLAVYCLAGNFYIQTLFISGNEFTEKGALSIAGAILHGTALRSLHLSANHVGPMGMIAIAGSITKNESRISQALEAGRIDGSFVRRMEELHLGNTQILSDGFIAIPTMIIGNMWLKVLSLSSNSLEDGEIALLSQALTQNKLLPLESLQLSFNRITCQGVECLLNAVWGSTTLSELKLDNNMIKDRGAQLCAVGLTSIALKCLDLSFNKVTTTGIKALMKNLAENATLQTLGLSGIPIDHNASKAVSFALAYNPSLRTLYLDNCSPGYASQRHIVAGAVSNRKSALRVVTGFCLSRIAMTLGMPRLPIEWSNSQVLGFFRLMWQQWTLKSRHGSSGSDDAAPKGPAPPAAVAAAAKIVLSAMGNQPEQLFHTEQHEKPMSETAPVEPARTALLERSDSGTMRVPLFTVASEHEIDDFIDGESKQAAMANVAPVPRSATVRAPLEDPERRNKNLQWLRVHYRALIDVGRLPFYNADLWQLHQYYLSPPYFDNDDEMAASETDDSDMNATVTSTSPSPTEDAAPLDQSVNPELLAVVVAASEKISKKRASNGAEREFDGAPATKRVKNVKPRIAYYPRIMAKIQSLGFKPMEQTLSLLRQLKYTESVLFSGRNPYTDFYARPSADAPCHADVDMILMDLL